MSHETIYQCVYGPARRSAGVIGNIGTVLTRTRTGRGGRAAPPYGSLPPAARRTIAFDRGTEFAAYPTLARELELQSYFCDPHSPWQKRAVENSNGRLRRYLPSDVDPARLAGRSLRELTDRLNDTPRRCLGYRTPREVFTEHVAPLPARSYTG